MSERDRRLWNERYRNTGLVPSIEPPTFLTDHLDMIPTTGAGLDIACGRGRGSLWMASLGLDVLGVDVSPMAIDLARRSAERFGLTDRCRFEIHDLDLGLPRPNGSPERFDMILCRLFRAPVLYPEMARRLAPGGLLAIILLAEAGGGSAMFRARADELARAFSDLTTHGSGFCDGRTWLVASRPKTA